MKRCSVRGCKAQLTDESKRYCSIHEYVGIGEVRDDDNNMGRKA